MRGRLDPLTIDQEMGDGGELRMLVWCCVSAVGKGQPYVEAMALRTSVNVEATVR